MKNDTNTSKDLLEESGKKDQKEMHMRTLTALQSVSKTIAHDIKNPLTNINFSVEQLGEEIEQDDVKVYLDIIKRNSGKIKELLDQLLHATLFETLEVKQADIHPLLDDVLVETKDYLTSKDIKVKKEYGEQLPPVSIDIEKMKTAFWNIILNAIDAMENHRGLLIIRTAHRKNKYIITIADNGVGMNEETVSKIFRPFFTTKGHEAAGLGLTEAQQIIFNHKGNLEVKSRLGEGTHLLISI